MTNEDSLSSLNFIALCLKYKVPLRNSNENILFSLKCITLLLKYLIKFLYKFQYVINSTIRLVPVTPSYDYSWKPVITLIRKTVLSRTKCNTKTHLDDFFVIAIQKFWNLKVKWHFYLMTILPVPCLLKCDFWSITYDPSKTLISHKTNKLLLEHIFFLVVSKILH